MPVLNLKANKKGRPLRNISVSKTENEVLIIQKEFESTERSSLHTQSKVIYKTVKVSFC
jgi:hypothetical protein